PHWGAGDCASIAAIVRFPPRQRFPRGMRFPGAVSRGKGPSKRHDGDDAKAAESVSQAKFILPQGHRRGGAAMSASSYAWLAPVVFAIVVIPAVGARCRGLAAGDRWRRGAGVGQLGCVRRRGPTRRARVADVPELGLACKAAPLRTLRDGGDAQWLEHPKA